MKKIFMIMAGLLCLVAMANCTKTVADKAVDIYDDATEKLEKANTAEEIIAVQTELGNALTELGKGNENVEFTDDEARKIDNAMQNYQDALTRKVAAFGPAAAGADVETFTTEPDGAEEATETGAADDAKAAEGI